VKMRSEAVGWRSSGSTVISSKGGGKIGFACRGAFNNVNEGSGKTLVL